MSSIVCILSFSEGDEVNAVFDAFEFLNKEEEEEEEEDSDDEDENENGGWVTSNINSSTVGSQKKKFLS